MLNAKTTLPLLLVNLLAVTADTSVNFKRKIHFGRPVVVSFNVDNPTTNDWIGIYRTNSKDSLSTNPVDTKLRYWAHTCSGVQELDQSSSCARPRTTGTVTFNGVDPTEEYWDQWPLNPRKYKVCLMRKTIDDNVEEGIELLADCVPLKINLGKKKKKKVANTAQVYALEPVVKYGVPFQVFFDSRFKVPNSWVGIYLPDNLKTEVMWVYTGCDNVLGDQELKPPDPTWVSSNDCLKKRKKGTVNFNATNTGRASQDWPLPEGEYVVRLEYLNNKPYWLNKQATTKLKVVA
mmetsp:Transcript_19507/g.23244  ORF Transcript_19507/g.23244 Transcript_19507/m.23244 type:complete len:291 (+) Transcript_19507:131-1003(+)